MSEKTAAEAMREAAAQLLESKGYGHWETLAALIRRLPLPDPTPDPRDEALRLATKALAWIEQAMRSLEWLESDYGSEFDDNHELGRIDESHEAPSFRIKVGHLRKVQSAYDALAAIEAIKGGV